MSGSDETGDGRDVQGWLRPFEAGRRLDPPVSAARVKQFVDQGRLEAVRTPHGRLINPASVDALLRERQARKGGRGG